MNSHHVMVDGRELKIVGEKCMEYERHDDSVDQFEKISVIYAYYIGRSSTLCYKRFQHE